MSDFDYFVKKAELIYPLIQFKDMMPICKAAWDCRWNGQTELHAILKRVVYIYNLGLHKGT